MASLAPPCLDDMLFSALTLLCLYLIPAFATWFACLPVAYALPIVYVYRVCRLCG
jgi:hypothetical protein